jgi:Sulfotransferase family
MKPLILLFGLPRSGTSWLGKIFDSHPTTIYRHEPDSCDSLRDVPLFPNRSEMTLFRSNAERFVSSLPRIRGIKIGASVPVFRKEYLPPPLYWAKRTVAWSARIASRALGEMPVPEWVDYEGLPNATIVWKSVESAGRLGLFGSCFPDARGILVLRHPCGHLASLFRSVELGKVAPGKSAFEDFGIVKLMLCTDQARKYGLTMSQFRVMTPAQRLAWRWVVMNEKAIDDTSELANCRVVRYEDVCTDPLGAAKELLRFGVLSWTGQTEQFVQASTSADNSRYYSIFKNPIRAANRWRSELSGATVAQIIGVLRSTAMNRYYPTEMPAPTVG